MALPIAPTPFLSGRDAERFDRIVAEDLAHNTLREPKRVDAQWLQRAIAALKERNKAALG